MNRRQFLSSVAGLGVSAALPTMPKTMPNITTPILTMDDYIVRILNPIVDRMLQSTEYRRAYEELLLYGYSTINVDKALAEIEPLDSRREPWHDGIAGRDQIG